MRIWFASGNAHKKRELETLFAPLFPGVDIRLPADAGLAFDPDETGTTFVENALIKARALRRLAPDHDAILADDSGLCVDALGGRPGVRSARYAGPGGGGVRPDPARPDPARLSPAERNRLLLDELGDNPLRSARFVCAMVLLFDADRFYIAQETFDGEIVDRAAGGRGDGGFGYDPIVFIPALGRTVAELTPAEKARYSHRGKAARAIARFLADPETRTHCGTCEATSRVAEQVP